MPWPCSSFQLALSWAFRLVWSGDDGRPRVYFTGNSLGLQPVDTESLLRAELDAWAREGVDAHFAKA